MILLGDRERVARFVQDRIDVQMPVQWGFEAIGFLDKSENLSGGVVYYNFTGEEIEASAAGEPGWLNTPTKLRAIFMYPFEELGVKRITAWVRRDNRLSREFVERLGFRLEGTKRIGPKSKDWMLYGMLKRECRWLKDNGQIVTKAA